MEDLEIELSDEEAGWLRQMVDEGLAHDAQQAVRAAIFEWYGAHRSTPNPFGVRGLLGDERRHAEV
jgi:hypothetical protein